MKSLFQLIGWMALTLFGLIIGPGMWLVGFFHFLVWIGIVQGPAC